jgi:GT2 family glycosyltransferase
VKLSIVIVNYRGWKRLEQCLASIRSLEKLPFTYEVIVVDNYSNDDTLDAFKSKFREFIFVENSGNNGFANGCNLGASHSKGSYILFLNPDTIVNSKAIETLVTTADIHPEIFILSCSQLDESGRNTKPFGYYPRISTLTGLLRSVYRLTHKPLQLKILKNELKAIFPDWVSGSVILVSKSKFEEVGRWNEDYWMYYEDVDLCKRINSIGGKIALLTEIQIEHNHGGASRLNSDIKVLTKTETIISKHVYIHNHFRGIKEFTIQTFLIVENAILAIISFLISLLTFFSVRKIRLYQKLYSSVILYYFTAHQNGMWLSIRSKKYRPK